eukprot:2483254-Pyramimonas_sp.AAC.1
MRRGGYSILRKGSEHGGGIIQDTGCEIEDERQEQDERGRRKEGGRRRGTTVSYTHLTLPTILLV